MLSQVTGRRTATTDALARRRLQLVAAEYVVRMGRRIAQAREEAGMSQNDLARALPGKVGAQMVSKWERGLHEPRSDTLESIARTLNKSVAYFMADEPEPGTPDLMEKLDGGGGGQRDQLERLDRIEAKVDLLLQHFSVAAPETTISDAIQRARAQLDTEGPPPEGVERRHHDRRTA